MADKRGKVNLKISAGLHRRLKVYSVFTDRPMEELADQILEAGLSAILANSSGAGDAAARAFRTVLDAEFRETLPKKKKH